MRRNRLVVAVALFVLTCPFDAKAGPQERFEAGYKDCSSKYDGVTSFTCSICGVTAGCDGDKCFWGSIKTSNVTSSGELDRLFQGYPLYCLNSGGTLVTAAGPVAQQTRSLDSAFRALRGGLSRADVGGIVEYTRYDGDAGSSYGVAVPIRYELGSGTLGTTIMAGTAPGGFKQIGVAGRYSLPLITPKEEGSAQILAIGVPFQLSHISGDGLDSSIGYAGGVTALYGFATSDRNAGFGLAADALYARGFVTPFQVAGRYSFGPDNKLAIQPALSSELLDPVEGLQETVFLGVDIGDSGLVEALGLRGGLVGAQVFYRSGNLTATLGISGTPRALASTRPDRGGARGTRHTPASVAPGGACTIHADCDGVGVCVGGTCIVPKEYEPSSSPVSIVVTAARPEIAAWVQGIANRALQGTRFERVRQDDVDAARPAGGGPLDDVGAKAIERRTRAKVVDIRVDETPEGLKVTVAVWNGEAFVSYAVAGSREDLGTELRVVLLKALAAK